MNILCWHVHGSWMTAFVQGRHNYYVPVNDARDEDGRGRALTWEWPPSVQEISLVDAQQHPFDVVVLQRPSELELARAWLGGRVLGRDVAAVYLEHNTPPGPVFDMRHPAADRADLVLVHITHCNAVFWDTGTTRTRVIANGIVDPGYRYSGELPHISVVINDAVRRGRATGTDLIDRFRTTAPVDLYGFDARRLGGTEGLDQALLHEQVARRRVHLHLNRWTSLSLSLIEAMHLGVPVIALATTEVGAAVPNACGFVSNDVDALIAGARELLHNPDLARERGRCGRAVARQRHGLARFLADWDALLEELAS